MIRGFVKNLALASVLLAIIAGLSACGRRGPLEPPPGSVTEQPASSTSLSGITDTKEEKKETPVEDRPFFLDPLI